MGRSLGLAAYRALSRRTSEGQFVPSGARPVGQLVWIHAAEAQNLLAIQDLAQRLCMARFGLHVLITLPDQHSYDAAQATWQPDERMHLELAPTEHPHAVNAFWRHWVPDMAIWAWGGLRPNLLYHAHKKTCPVALIDADASGFDGRRDRWLPDLSRQLLQPCAALLVRSSAALKKLENLGVSTGRIDVTPPLQAGGHALSCHESDLADLSQTLSGRPVWLASNVQQAELKTVLKAHRQAMRLAHRLLLVLNPAEGSPMDAFARQITDDGLRLADWSAGDSPDDATQVLLAPDHRDLGLFYRVAPVTFMGSSLATGHSGRNPFEAATLGSAVLYGPNVRRFMPFYSRLAKAGAARIVKDAETLGAAVTQLIAPDQAAAMAHAGWDVVSQGADLTDRVIELVQAGLDGELTVHNARA
ncbi:3-deoxy-D-manno-octulosonic acid transferase [Roseobacter weihaiensis]|uniref:3-deoxy-D-manno-octulosonic acid transferase n=1 Tax=Roseobacter weihaiensis TaxID=2763262 RepID=UPI001D0A0F1D|nr:glycosyltransferase N-terminal domain-containing protein [Roseobacter sp. H9]